MPGESTVGAYWFPFHTTAAWGVGGVLDMPKPCSPVTKGAAYDDPPRSPAGVPRAVCTAAEFSPGLGNVPVKAFPKSPTFRADAPTARFAFGSSPAKSPPNAPMLNAAALFARPSDPLESETSAERGYPTHATPFQIRMFPALALGTQPVHPPPPPVVTIN